MPYIRPVARAALADGADPIGPGELNYVITLALLQYIKEFGLTYQTINDILGVLVAVQLEFNRRVVVPYEQQKCKVNGDVYPPWEVSDEQNTQC